MPNPDKNGLINYELVQGQIHRML